MQWRHTNAITSPVGALLCTKDCTRRLLHLPSLSSTNIPLLVPPGVNLHQSYKYSLHRFVLDLFLMVFVKLKKATNTETAILSS